MAHYNKVILIGNLTRDPQMSYLPSQTAVVELGMAVNRRWRSQDGQQREDTCFVDCRAYGKQAETLNQYVRKGNPILIEGRLQFDQWEGKDGQRRSKHRVVVEKFQFLGSAGGGGGGGGGGFRGGGPASGPQGRGAGGSAPPAPPRGGAPDAPADEGPGGQGDEIPF